MEVWKHEITIPDLYKQIIAPGQKDEIRFEMPDSGYVVRIAEARPERVSIWFAGDPNAPKVMKRIRVVGTGQPFEVGLAHLETVILRHGDLVLHFFDLGQSVEGLRR